MSGPRTGRGADSFICYPKGAEIAIAATAWANQRLADDGFQDDVKRLASSCRIDRCEGDALW
jgi:hypothetical protein